MRYNHKQYGRMNAKLTVVVYVQNYVRIPSLISLTLNY